MRATTIRQFTLSLMSYKGALVEEGAGDAGVLLGTELAASLRLNEYERLVFDPSAEAAGSVRVDYDAPAFEAVGRVAEGLKRVACVSLSEAPELRPIDPEKELDRALKLQNGVFRFRACTPAIHLYFCFFLQYDVLADERSGGLEEIWVNPAARSIPGLPSLLDSLSTRDVAPPPDFGALLLSASNLALANGACSIRARLGRFLQSLERRRARDFERMRDYYQAIDQEIRRKIARQIQKSLEGQETGRLAATARTYEIRCRELLERYRSTLHVTPLAVVACAIPVYEIHVQLHRRSARADALFSWNPFDRRIEPRCCDGCHRGTETAALCDDRVHYLCLECFKPCPECTRVFCRACHSRCPRRHSS